MRAQRLLHSPIITAASCDRIGTNINGPSLIKVPDWVEAPLGSYYLYFAHHRGDHIRLAYADSVTGPWHVHRPGVLPLSEAGFSHHIASPEIVVDDTAREIRMFFHGGDEIKNQYTRLATSRDGLAFAAGAENLMNPYARIFNHRGSTYAIAMPGQFYRSADGRNFEAGPLLFTRDMRHAAVWVEDDLLHVIYSNRGDAPESLLHCTIDLLTDWNGWQPSAPTVLLAPERDYEGAHLPVVPSVIGPADEPVNQLRDPAVYFEDGRRYLIYAIAGEQGLALAELFPS